MKRTMETVKLGLIETIVYRLRVTTSAHESKLLTEENINELFDDTERLINEYRKHIIDTLPEK